MDITAVKGFLKQQGRERFSEYLLSYIKNGDMNTIKSFRFQTIGGIEGKIKEFTPLTAALIHGKPDIARYFILNLGADVNRCDFHDNYPIGIAVQKGYVNIVKLCLKNGCSLDFVDSNGNTLLHIAAQYLKFEMLRFLLEKGLDPGKRNAKDSSVLKHISQDVQIPRDGRSRAMKTKIIEFLQNYITTTLAEKEGLPSLEQVSEIPPLDTPTVSNTLKETQFPVTRDSFLNSNPFTIEKEFPTTTTSIKTTRERIESKDEDEDEDSSSSDSPILKPRKKKKFFGASEIGKKKEISQIVDSKPNAQPKQTPPIPKAKQKISMPAENGQQKMKHVPHKSIFSDFSFSMKETSIPFINLLDEGKSNSTSGPTFSQNLPPVNTDVLFENFNDEEKVKQKQQQQQQENSSSNSAPIFSKLKSQTKKMKKRKRNENNFTRQNDPPKKKQKIYKNTTNPMITIVDEVVYKKAPNPYLSQEKKKKKKIVEFSNCGCWSCVDFGRKYYPGIDFIQMY